MSTELFSAAEYAALTEQHQRRIRELVLLFGDDSFMPDALDEHLDLWGPCEGCVPAAYVENLLENIMTKFEFPLRVARNAITRALGIDDYKVQIVCEPSYEDRTRAVVIVVDHHIVIYDEASKAWNYQFATLQELANEIDRLVIALSANYMQRMPDPEIVNFSWSASDVLSVRPDLTRDQAIEVLHRAKSKHDADTGINWDVLETHAALLFGPHTGETPDVEDEEDVCDECGSVYPADAAGMFGPWHQQSCSLYALESD
jgi:hypothetical protein